MSTRRSPSTGQPYGLTRITRAWGVSRATVYRHRRPAEPSGRRPGPLGPMDDLVTAIRGVIGAGGFHGEGYRKVWARLRFAGVRTSRRRVLRLMRKQEFATASQLEMTFSP